MFCKKSISTLRFIVYYHTHNVFIKIMLICQICDLKIKNKQNVGCKTHKYHKACAGNKKNATLILKCQACSESNGYPISRMLSNVTQSLFQVQKNAYNLQDYAINAMLKNLIMPM